jgi:hypothetical protein
VEPPLDGVTANKAGYGPGRRFCALTTEGQRPEPLAPLEKSAGLRDDPVLFVIHFAHDELCGESSSTSSGSQLLPADIAASS